MPVRYRIDRNDRIVEIGGDWDAFAAENGGLPPVVGQRLWEFVRGQDVRAVWSVLLLRARSSRQPLSFAYRCDAPGLRRVMQMELRADGSQAVEFLSTVVEEEPDVVLGGPWAGDDDPAMIVVCGWCGRARTDAWQDPHQVIALLGDRLPKLSHGICDECLKRLRTN